MNRIIILLLAIGQFFSLSLQAAPEQRIVSLVPSQTEMLFSLGLGDKVVGISSYCNYPPQAAELPRIGDMDLSIEKIMTLKPTILIDANNMHRKYEMLFRQLGLNYVNFSITGLDNIPQMARELSQLLGFPEKGDQFAENWNSQTAPANLPKPMKEVKVYLEIWDTPMQGAGDTSFIGQMISKAGGKNIIAGAQEYPVMNYESIISADPDIILLAYPANDTQSIKARPGWQNIQAVKNNRIHRLDQDLFVRPGPRNIEGLKILNGLFQQIR
jgi:iron complex transport system substrate-binding protein